MAERTRNEHGAKTRLPSTLGRGRTLLVVHRSVARGLAAACAPSRQDGGCGGRDLWAQREESRRRRFPWVVYPLASRGARA
jgi:hypothetical protein